MTPDRERTAVHEAAHAVAAYVLGRGISLVSIRRTEHHAGIASLGPLRMNGSRGKPPTHLPAIPAILWPAHPRRAIEADICVSLAGNVAETVSAPFRWTGVHMVDERRAMKAASALADLSQRDGELLKRFEGAEKPSPTDEEQARSMAWVLSGDQAVAHVNYLREVTRGIVHVHRSAIEALAEVLLDREVVSGRTARAVLRNAAEGGKQDGALRGNRIG